MTDLNLVRLGQTNSTGPTDANFAKVYAGEVITAFEGLNVMLERTMVRTIEHGKSAAFPATGNIDAYYHTPGQKLIGQVVNQSEVLIHIDDLLTSPAFISNIEEAKLHYDMRSIITTGQGRKLAKTLDQHLLQVGVIAARSANVIADLPGGSVINQTADTNLELSGDDLAAAIFAAAEKFDEKDVPEEDRSFYVRPKQYYNLVKAEKTINRDYGGSGAYSDGKVFRVAGMEIVKTNNLPNLNVTTGVRAGGTAARYAGDFSNTVGLAMQKSAIGTVKLLDLALDMSYETAYQAHLVVSKYALGHGILVPQAAIEVSKAVL
jgi:hypothetical protein